MSNKEILTNAIANMSPEDKEKVFPPITRKNFVVRQNWLGRNQIITFINNKDVKVTYNHDEVLNLMLPKLKIMPCWIKRGYWSQSTDMPKNTRHLSERLKIEDIDVVVDYIEAK
tara:strand:- start:747 stop:1088 length:342 start_codon:yes stop_codon:yes gene_type:complete